MPPASRMPLKKTWPVGALSVASVGLSYPDYLDIAAQRRPRANWCPGRVVAGAVRFRRDDPELAVGLHPDRTRPGLVDIVVAAKPVSTITPTPGC